MKTFTLGSISRNLALLVIIAVLPAMLILLYSGIEDRRQSIREARHNSIILTHSMAKVQRDVTESVRHMLAMLSILPEVQNLDQKACAEIFAGVLKQNPSYINITLTDPAGKVLASGSPMVVRDLGDRKHVQEAARKRSFAVGEYVISRHVSQAPAFPFAYPVIDKDGGLKGVLTAPLKLEDFSRFHDVSELPEDSFVAITDYKGIRLFYYPSNEDTNPVGKSIISSSWEAVTESGDSGVFTGPGSDGMLRLFSFEKVRLTPEQEPYLVVWAGIPEAQITANANEALTRNLLLLLLATLLSLFVSWVIGRRMIFVQIKDLVAMTRKFAKGELLARAELPVTADEFGTLKSAFYDMANALSKSQKILLDNEARFRLLMDSLDAIVYVADMNTYELLFINEYGRERFGDVVGRICWQTIQKDQGGPCSFCTNKYLLREDGTPGDVYTWEFKNTITGQYFYIQDRAIQWIDGRIVRLEIATDITQRKMAEIRLAEETERLAVTLRSIGDGVITTDTRGNVVLINKVAETLTGWNSQEAAGRPLADIFHVIHAETRLPLESPAQKILSTGEVVGLSAHAVLISKEGRERMVADSGAPIRAQDGTIVGVVIVFRDVTEQLRTEKELLKVKKLESIGVLAGGIAHDFNNILSAILGNISLALFDKGLQEKTRGFLSSAEKASLRARDLTQQLLTFAKGGEPVKETSSLGNVIRDSANFVLSGDKVACRFDIPDDLWLADVDKGQISQVIQNLVLNASQAMPEGGIIRIDCQNVPALSKGAHSFGTGERFVKIAISDTGVGMPPSILDKIFDPYFSTKQAGSGLGLAISQSIIRKHGGHIAAESLPGKGSTFTIYLPASGKVAAYQREASDEVAAAPKAKILVMDDEEIVRSTVKEMLEFSGHNVTLTADGEQAIEAYRKSITAGAKFDLVIMDLTIPGGMGGKETVRKLLDINNGAKVIASSGYSNDPIMANFRDYGFCAAVAKPYRLQEITKVIGQFLR